MNTLFQEKHTQLLRLFSGEDDSNTPELLRKNALYQGIQHVKVSGGTVTLLVSPSPDSGCHVKVEGCRDFMESCSIFAENGSLHIEVSPHKNNFVLQWGNKKQLSETLGRIWIQCNELDSFAVESSGAGDILIGVPVQKTTCHTVGSQSVALLETNHASTKITGSGDILIQQLHGPLTGTINGSGDVTVKSGSLSELSFEINGSGDLNIYAPIADATVSLNGSGHIRLAEVSGECNSKNNGSGKIEILKH